MKLRQCIQEVNVDNSNDIAVHPTLSQSLPLIFLFRPRHAFSPHELTVNVHHIPL